MGLRRKAGWLPGSPSSPWSSRCVSAKAPWRCHDVIPLSLPFWPKPFSFMRPGVTATIPSFRTRAMLEALLAIQASAPSSLRPCSLASPTPGEHARNPARAKDKYQDVHAWARPCAQACLPADTPKVDRPRPCVLGGLPDWRCSRGKTKTKLWCDASGRRETSSPVAGMWRSPRAAHCFGRWPGPSSWHARC